LINFFCGSLGVYAAATGSMRLESLFLTLPTRAHRPADHVTGRVGRQHCFGIKKLKSPKVSSVGHTFPVPAVAVDADLPRCATERARAMSAPAVTGWLWIQ
jgi:hypothetical protein